MQRIIFLLSTVLLIVTSFSAFAQQPTAPSPDQNSIQQTARAFVEAYDSGNAQAVAELWTDDGEYTVGQSTVKGRPAIQRLYEEFLRAHPGSKMEIKIKSIRVLAPTVALEQGTASVSNSPNGPPSASTYSAVHVKQNGKWRMASVRESEPLTRPSDADLQQLAWLVGDWAASGDAAKVEVSYKWMANEKFLRGETIIRPAEGTDALPGGLQIVGRDPLSGQIVSWFFHADGGHGYGVWTKDGSRWLIHTQGATADGAPTIATNLLYHADDNVLSWQSVNRAIGGQPLPNTKETALERVTANSSGS